MLIDRSSAQEARTAHTFLRPPHSQMTAIQAVYVKGHEERSQPKPHTVYRIEIQASVRSWSMWRRYSEFVDLHTELTKSTSSPPPASLPPKHTFSVLSLRPLHDRDAG